MPRDVHLWSAPDTAHATAVAPANDAAAVAAASRRLVASKASRLPWVPFRRSRRRASCGRLMLTGPGMAAQGEGPPWHLQQLAREHGFDIAAHRWLVDAPSTYPSRKVIHFLFTEEPEEPEFVIKTTREERFNPRLNREARALELLVRTTSLPASVAPRVLFRGYAGRLLVVAESPLTGRTLRDASRPTAESDAFARGVDWIVDLGLAAPHWASSAAVAEALESVVASFAATCDPEPWVLAHVQDCLVKIAASHTPFPVVFEHGDPGPWNGILAADGFVGFHDWENATARGMPLWDLFHFARSHAVWSARARGRRDRIAAVTSALMERSPLASKLEPAVRRVAERLQLAPGLVWPLFVLCWVERAVREASTLGPDVPGGHFTSLVRACALRSGLPWWPEKPR